MARLSHSNQSLPEPGTEHGFVSAGLSRRCADHRRPLNPAGAAVCVCESGPSVHSKRIAGADRRGSDVRGWWRRERPLPAGGPSRQTSTVAVPQFCFVAFGLALLFPALADRLAKPFVVLGRAAAKTGTITQGASVLSSIVLASRPASCGRPARGRCRASSRPAPLLRARASRSQADQALHLTVRRGWGSLVTEGDQVGRRLLEPVNLRSSSLQLRRSRRSDNRKFPFALERADTGPFVGMDVGGNEHSEHRLVRKMDDAIAMKCRRSEKPARPVSPRPAEHRP
jgi:hypothetical protein